MTPRTATSTASPVHAARRGSLGGIWAGGLLALLGGWLLLWQYPFLGHATELVDLWKMSDGDTLGAVAYAAAVGLMLVGWLVAMRAAQGITFNDAWLPVLTVTGLLYLTYGLVYPGTAIDVYIYAARSHLLTDHGLDPSTVTPERLWDVDAYVRYASQEWGDDTSPYGPLWNVIAAPATAFDGERIGTAVLIFKGIMAAATAGAGVLLYRIARVVQPGWALGATLTFLWSPIVLWEGIANSHNDVVLMLLVIAALWCWHTRREGGVLPLLGAAALLKVVTVMLLPAALVAIVARIGWNRRLLAVTAQTVALSAATLWVAFTPFYDIRGTVDAIQEQRDVWVTSPALLLDLILRELNDWTGYRDAYARFSSAVIVLLAAGGALAAWRRPAWLPRIAYEQLFWFLLLATSNMRPWYVIWLVALAVVLPMGWPLARAAAWMSGALLSYIFTGWVQTWAGLDHLERTTGVLAITLLPPLIVTGVEAARALRQRRPPSAAALTPYSSPR